MDIKFFVKDYWSIVLSCIALVTSVIIVWRYKIPDIEKRLAKVELTSHSQEVTRLDLTDRVSKHEIYRKDGSYIYQQSEGCKKMQDTCQTKICMKIDGVTKIMNKRMVSIEDKMEEMDLSRESTRSEFKEVLEKLHKQQVEMVRVATQVKTLLANGQAQQTAIIVREVLKEIKQNRLV